MTNHQDLVKRLRDMAWSYSGHEGPDLLHQAADALEATPAPAVPDALPEGWVALPRAARTSDDAVVSVEPNGSWLERSDRIELDRIGPATMTLAEACRAADERFPVVVKVEAPAKTGHSGEKLRRCAIAAQKQFNNPGDDGWAGVAEAVLEEAAKSDPGEVAPEEKWTEERKGLTWRRADGVAVHKTSVGRAFGYDDVFPVFFLNGLRTTAAFPTAEEAMAWADRERSVA